MTAHGCALRIWHMDTSDFARVRRFLGKTQFDIAVGTGVPLGRIGGAERGSIRLNHCETLAISNYLEKWLRYALGDGEKKVPSELQRLVE